MGKKKVKTEIKRDVNSPKPAPMGKRPGWLRSSRLHIMVIVILGFLAYSNTFSSPFQLDEEDFLIKNPLVQDLSFFWHPEKAVGYKAYDGFKSRYIGYLTFALNYKFHKFEVFGYHLVNVLIHISNALLVYWFVLLTFRTPFLSPNTPGPSLSDESQLQKFLAAAGALLFVAHPVQTEAVTYVFQRFASLVTLFYLLSISLYIKARLYDYAPAPRAKKKWAFYGLSFVLAVLAMKTKENAFTLPVVVTLYEFFFFSGPVKSRIMKLAPLVLTIAIIPITLVGIEKPIGEIIRQTTDVESFGAPQYTRDVYFFTQLRVIVTYLRLLILPVNQNLWYDYPKYSSLFEAPVFLSFILLALIFSSGLLLLRRSMQDRKAVPEGKERESFTELRVRQFTRVMAFGIFWFFITLSIESSIIPIPMLIDEYRVYLPSIGLILSALFGGFLLFRRSESAAEIVSTPTLAVCLALVLALSGATFSRNEVWKDKITLWEDVSRKSPKLLGAYDNVGLAYKKKGDYGKAIQNFQKCLEINPSYPYAYTNLGVTYAELGRMDLALKYFHGSASLNPKNFVVYNNLGRAYSDLRRYDVAAENYLKAATFNPVDTTAFHGLGTAYSNLGRYDEALAAFTKFISLSPRDPEAYRNRGIVHLQRGAREAAAADFRDACSLGDAEACRSATQL